MSPHSRAAAAATPWIASRLRALVPAVSVGLFALALVLPPAVARADDDPVLARVNGVAIHQSDLKLAEEDLSGNLPPNIPADAKRDYLVSYLSDIIIVAQAAEKKGLQKTEDFKQREAFIRKKLLMGQLLQAEAKAAMTDAAMKKVYDEAISKMGKQEEVHARHILFRVEDPKDEKASKEAKAKAEAAIARIKKGEDFAKVANELTEDPSGKETGGDLGYFTKDQMVAPFSEAAFKLAKGEVSEPVKTDFGWHVIKLEDKRQKPPPTFDKVKEQIEKFVTQKAQTEMITELRKEAKIEKLYKTAEPEKSDADQPAKATDKPDAKAKTDKK